MDTTFSQRFAAFVLRELAVALEPYRPTPPPPPPPPSSPPRPGPLSVQLISEEADMLRYRPILPDPGAPDVASRELTITRDGVDEVVTFAFPGDVPTFTADQGAGVTLTLIDIDDATPPNRSEPSPEYTFVANDTLPPPAPDTLGAELIGEE